MQQSTQLKPQKYRSIWISDVHLGFRGCSADYLLDFLHSTESEHLYLVGDILDVWAMKKRLYWPQEHSNVVRTVLGKAKRNTQIIFVPGNHDEMLRDYDGMRFGNIRVQNHLVHTTADGKRLLVIHGDQFDSVVRCSKALAILGNQAYDWLLRANVLVNICRRKLGFPYWSLAGYLKSKVKNAVQYISNFEEAVSHEAKKYKVDGVVCGHIHRAEMTQINGLTYCNCGDWVESCTALVEHQDGRLELINWLDKVNAVDAYSKTAAA